jgi:hypothetical protein
MKASRRRVAIDRIRIAGGMLTILLLAGCGGGNTKPSDPGNNPPGGVPTYTADVAPIIEAGCTCHQPGGIKYSTVPLDTYARVFARRDRVKQRAGVEGSMPPTGALPQSKRQTIIAWVDGGAPE